MFDYNYNYNYSQCCCPSHRQHSNVCSYLRLYSGLTSLAPYSTVYTVQDPFPYAQLSRWTSSNLSEMFLHCGLLFTCIFLFGLMVIPLMLCAMSQPRNFACVRPFPLPDLELSLTVPAPAVTSPLTLPSSRYTLRHSYSLAQALMPVESAAELRDTMQSI